ncbi:class F sortase [Nocardioides ungokensis]|uniref:class F sortase n=1 Tax=Nocardioides ungokensis TaxID=1643322 RepID=UPI0015DEEF52|nr:class F sortase [Nocardioides ungokensis]
MRPSDVAAAVLAAALLGACSASGAGTSATGNQAAHVDAAARPAAVATPAASQERTERPVSVTLPSGRVLPVDVVRTLPGGALAIPRDIHRAGWWAGSSRLGDPFGSIVLAAHVDSFTQGVGPAAELLSTRPGARVHLAARHRAQSYRVTSVRVVPRADLRREEVVFSAAGSRRLVLITCGGAYDAARGGYQDNVVVVARPTRHS